MNRTTVVFLHIQCSEKQALATRKEQLDVVLLENEEAIRLLKKKVSCGHGSTNTDTQDTSSVSYQKQRERRWPRG